MKRPKLKAPNVKLPKLKAPDVKLPKLKAPDIKTPDVKLPQVVEDVYRDLRDRRLLPVIALLAAAIVAVPIVLSGSDAPSTSGSTAAEIVPADAPEAQAAVLAENPGLRDYEQRLDRLKAQNPFEQQFVNSALEGTEVQSGTEVTSGTASDSGTTSSGTTSSGSDFGASGGDTSVGTGSEGAAPVAPESGGVTTDDASGEQEIAYFTFRADLQYGVEGALSEHKNVKIMDMLSPIGTFLGASGNAKRAVFGLSSDVVAVSGEGQCLPDPATCDFLALQKGQSETLTYQPPDGSPAVVYQLVVDDIRTVRVRKPPRIAE